MKHIKTIYNKFINESKINDNFWKWFDHSKIIDEEGKPLVVYHGSKFKFNSFDDRKKGSNTDPGIRGRGFYFSTNLKSSQSYGNFIQEVYLKITNPLDLLSFNSLEEIIDLLEIDSGIIFETGVKGTLNYSIKVYAPYSGIFTSSVKEKGYDGIKHGQEIIAFYPNQIKSINNDGSWDINDKNIYS